MATMSKPAPKETKSDMLTRDQIESAKNDRSHVVTRIIDQIGMAHWTDLTNLLRVTKDNQEQQRLCSKSMIPFAEALGREVFTLEPLEIVSIWAKALEVFPDNCYPRYDLSTSIACAYGTIPISSEAWKHLFNASIGL
jgi:hypothetical protein